LKKERSIFRIDEDANDRFQNMKKRRISKLMNVLKKLKKVDKAELLASCSVNFGWNIKTTRYYLRDLETLGKITDKNGNIEWCTEEEKTEEQ